MKKWITIVMLAAMAAASAVAQEEAAPAVAQEEEMPAVQSGPKGMAVEIPHSIYGNCDDAGSPAFIASGWMGSVDSIEFDDCWKENAHQGDSCIKVAFTDPRGWGGIAWQSPANNWGDDEGGVDLTGAKKLVFWARGDQGGEMVEFKMGIIPKNKPYFDTGKASLGRVKLEKTWQKFEIPLEGKDLGRIMTGFVFSVKGRTEPVVFYLDDIVYE